MAYKTHQGKYKVKNRDKYEGNPDTVVYRSGWERSCFLWADKTPQVVKWSSEEVIIPYLSEVDQRYHRYFMDLKLTMESGQVVLVEIKPESQTKPPTGNKRTKRYISEGLTYVTNKCKWTAAQEYAADRGWTFEIWTEKHLQAKGIMPKSLGKVPGKLKPRPKAKRKRINRTKKPRK